MALFARGESAYGYCKQCGFRYFLHELRIDGRFPQQRLMVCSTCWDPYDPQEHPFPPAIDPQALAWPSPDTGRPEETIEGSSGNLNGGNSTTTYFTAYFGGNASTGQAQYEFNQVYGGNAYSGQQELVL